MRYMNDYIRPENVTRKSRPGKQAGILTWKSNFRKSTSKHGSKNIVVHTVDNSPIAKMTRMAGNMKDLSNLCAPEAHRLHSRVGIAFMSLVRIKITGSLPGIGAMVTAPTKLPARHKPTSAQCAWGCRCIYTYMYCKVSKRIYIVLINMCMKRKERERRWAQSLFCVSCSILVRHSTSRFLRCWRCRLVKAQ